MAYISRADVESALGQAMISAIFDDDGDGVVEQPTVEAMIARACAYADSWIDPVYAGPFPITVLPVPFMVRELSMQCFRAMAFDRRPDVVKAMGLEEEHKTCWAQAEKLGERLQSATLRIPDLTTQTRGFNVGGIVIDDGARVMTTSLDGSRNSGDF